MTELLNTGEPVSDADKREAQANLDIQRKASELVEKFSKGKLAVMRQAVQDAPMFQVDAGRNEEEFKAQADFAVTELLSSALAAPTNEEISQIVLQLFRADEEITLEEYRERLRASGQVDEETIQELMSTGEDLAEWIGQQKSYSADQVIDLRRAMGLLPKQRPVSMPPAASLSALAAAPVSPDAGTVTPPTIPPPAPQAATGEGQPAQPGQGQDGNGTPYEGVQQKALGELSSLQQRKQDAHDRGDVQEESKMLWEMKNFFNSPEGKMLLRVGNGVALTAWGAVVLYIGLVWVVCQYGRKGGGH